MRSVTITNENGDELVRINLTDGTVTFAKDYNPDEAARIFWNRLGKEARCGDGR